MSSFLAFERCPPQLRNYCCWLIGGWKLVLCRRYRSLLDIFDESGASPSTTCSVLYHNMSLLQTLQTLAEIWVLKYESFFEAPFIGSSTQWLTHWVTDTLNQCLREAQCYKPCQKIRNTKNMGVGWRDNDIDKIINLWMNGRL